MRAPRLHGDQEHMLDAGTIHLLDEVLSRVAPRRALGSAPIFSVMNVFDHSGRLLLIVVEFVVADRVDRLDVVRSRRSILG